MNKEKKMDAEELTRFYCKGKKSGLKDVRCFHCNKIIKVCDDLRGLNLSPYICEECWRKECPDNLSIKYISDGFKEVEILSFKAVTQEKNVQICCYSKKCGQDTHSIGDVVIFMNCKVKDSDGTIRDYGAFYIFPPKQYWCLYGITEGR